MVISLPDSQTELKSLLQHLDKVILGKVMEHAGACYKATLEKIDDAIAGCRNGDLLIEHRREVYYQTCLGPIKVMRRVYRDGEGRRRCLMDELMGMSNYRHITRNVQELVIEMASKMPYRKSAEVLRKTSAIDLAHQTVWRLVATVADPYIEKAERERKWFQETGEIQWSGTKKVARLMVEADGVILSLQREKERKTEVKLGIAYEGWERVGKDRYRTVNKTAFAAVAGEQAFWAGMSLKLQETYDLSRVGETIVGGDGASWVKEGARYINGRFQLDRYHLNRELTTALGRDKETKGKVWQACQCGDVETGLRIMAEAMKQAKGEQAQRIAKAYHYLHDNSSGIEDYRMKLGDEGKGLRRTGAMEGNVDKLVVRRMKNQGMSWTIKGIRRLLCVRFLVLEGNLTGWLEHGDEKKPAIISHRKKISRIVRRALVSDPGDWLQMDLPALQGPHASRPWVRVLRTITEAPHI